MSKTEWEEYKLGDIASFKYGTMPKKDLVSLGGQFPIYSGYRVVGSYPEYNLEQSELIIVARGVGGTGDVKLSPEKCFLTNLSIVAFLDESIILKKYAYYYFALNNLRYLDSGSAQSQITISDLQKVVVPVPPLAEQQRIAKILSSLDDKIELNNAINRNLEEQAQAIFKSWFIDFEPFGGEMPSDWKTGSLSDIADYLNGLAMQKFRPKDGEIGLPVLKIKELRQGFAGEDAELCSPSIKSEYIVNDGDVIFSWSGSLLVDLWCGGKCGLNQHLFKVTSKHYDKWFYYMWTKHHLDRFVFLAADKATTMGHIKRDELDKAEVCVPSKADYDKIGRTLEPMIETIIAKRIENNHLTALRDTLLSQLIPLLK